MEESEDTEVNLLTANIRDLEAVSKLSSEKSLAMKPDEKFLEMHEEVRKSVHYLCPSFEWSALASFQFIMWSAYSADGSEILKRILLSPNMRIRIFFKEKELIIPEQLKSVGDIARMEKVLVFVSKIAPCEIPDGKQRAKECIGYVLPKNQHDPDSAKTRCVACRKLLKNLRPKLLINKWRDNSTLGVKFNILQRKYHNLQRKVRTCLLEIGELKKDAAKNKQNISDESAPKKLISQEEAETIFLRDLNNSAAKEKDETSEMRVDANDPLAIGPFSSFYEDSLWSFADSDENKATKQKTQKSEKAKLDWKKHKEACNRGQAYLNKKGVLVRARKMGVGCDESCRFRCQERISMENRQKVFDYYWKLGSHPLQWNFLLKVVGSTEPKSQKTNSTSKKKWTRNYSLPAENKRIKVCKTMFLKTLDISDSIVETALNKVRQNAALIDRRGKNSKTNHKKLEAMNESVRDHLNKLPISEFKFLYDGCKKQNSAKKVNIRHMYKVYKDWMERERKGEPVAGEKRYRHNFKLGFKLKFKQENFEID